eukprot:g3730.t1
MNKVFLLNAERRTLKPHLFTEYKADVDRALNNGGLQGTTILSAADHGFFWIPETWTSLTVRFQKLKIANPLVRGGDQSATVSPAASVKSRPPDAFTQAYEFTAPASRSPTDLGSSAPISRLPPLLDSEDVRLLQGLGISDLTSSVVSLRRTPLRRLSQNAIVKVDASECSNHDDPQLEQNPKLTALLHAIACTRPRWREFGVIVADLGKGVYESYVYYVDQYTTLSCEVQNLADEIQANRERLHEKERMRRLKVKKEEDEHKARVSADKRKRGHAAMKMKSGPRGAANGMKKMGRSVAMKMNKGAMKKVSAISSIRHSSNKNIRAKLQQAKQRVANAEKKIEKHMEKMWMENHEKRNFLTVPGAAGAGAAAKSTKAQQHVHGKSTTRSPGSNLPGPTSAGAPRTSSSSTSAGGNGNANGSSNLQHEVNLHVGTSFLLHHDTEMEGLERNLDQLKHEDEFCALLLAKHKINLQSKLNFSISSTAGAAEANGGPAQHANGPTLNIKSTPPGSPATGAGAAITFTFAQQQHALRELLSELLAQWKVLISRYQKFLLEGSKLGKLLSRTASAVRFRSRHEQEQEERELALFRQMVLYCFRNLLNLCTIELEMSNTSGNEVIHPTAVGVFNESAAPNSLCESAIQHAEEASILWCSMLAEHASAIPSPCINRIDLAMLLMAKEEREKKERERKLMAGMNLQFISSTSPPGGGLGRFSSGGHQNANDDNVPSYKQLIMAGQGYMLPASLAGATEAKRRKMAQQIGNGGGGAFGGGITSGTHGNQPNLPLATSQIVPLSPPASPRSRVAKEQAARLHLSRLAQNLRFFMQPTLLARMNPLMTHGLMIPHEAFADDGAVVSASTTSSPTNGTTNPGMLMLSKHDHASSGSSGGDHSHIVLHCCMICGTPGWRFRETESGYRVCNQGSYCYLSAMEKKKQEIRRVHWKRAEGARIEPSWQWVGAQTRLRFSKLSNMAVGTPIICATTSPRRTPIDHNTSTQSRSPALVSKLEQNCSSHQLRKEHVEQSIGRSVSAGSAQSKTTLSPGARSAASSRRMEEELPRVEFFTQKNPSFAAPQMLDLVEQGRQLRETYDEMPALDLRAMEMKAAGGTIGNGNGRNYTTSSKTQTQTHTAAAEASAVVPVIRKSVDITVLTTFQETTEDVENQDDGEGIESVATVDKILLKLDHTGDVKFNSHGRLNELRIAKHAAEMAIRQSDPNKRLSGKGSSNSPKAKPKTHQQGRNNKVAPTSIKNGSPRLPVRKAASASSPKMKPAASPKRKAAAATPKFGPKSIRVSSSSEDEQNGKSNSTSRLAKTCSHVSVAPGEEQELATALGGHNLLLGVRKSLHFTKKARSDAAIANEVEEYERELSYLRTAAEKNCRHVIGLVCSYTVPAMHLRAFVMELGTCDMSQWLREKQTPGATYDIGKYFKQILHGTLEVHRRVGVLNMKRDQQMLTIFCSRVILNGDVSIENFVYCRSSDLLKTIDLGACRNKGEDCCHYKISWVEPERIVNPLEESEEAGGGRGTAAGKDVEDEEADAADGEDAAGEGDSEDDDESEASESSSENPEKLHYDFHPVTEKSDFWACGIILYKMVYGLPLNPVTDLVRSKKLEANDPQRPMTDPQHETTRPMADPQLLEDDYAEVLLTIKEQKSPSFRFELPKESAWSTHVRVGEFEPALRVILNADPARRDIFECERLLPSCLPGEEYSDLEDLA